MDDCDLYKAFYVAWLRAESARGCYSCCPPHDARCLKNRGIGECSCGRDELEELERAIEAQRRGV